MTRMVDSCSSSPETLRLLIAGDDLPPQRNPLASQEALNETCFPDQERDRRDCQNDQCGVNDGKYR